MRTWIAKWAGILSLLLVLAVFLPMPAYAWETQQQALNNIRDEDATTIVLLRKLEKKANGTATENVIPGAVFRLYTEDGTLIGGPFATDLNGQIKVKLPPGSYYYEETTPPSGYTYDWDRDGHAIRRYPFAVRETESNLLVLAYNRRESSHASLQVTLPDIVKKVEGETAPSETFTFLLKGAAGCPMPDGTTGGTWKVSRVGEGTAALGKLRFERSGDYTYTICELAGDDYNWTYDPAEYRLTVHISTKRGSLSCDGFTLQKDGKNAEGIVFTNRYEKKNLNESIVIRGQKIWNHKDNPEQSRPDHIVVKLYADGSLIRQREVTAETDWTYSFTLPKYTANGEEIQYALDEDAVEDYDKKVRGYDLINTYVGEAVLPENPDQSADPGNPSSPADPDGTDTKPSVKPSKPPKTGDEFALTFWITAGLIGFAGFWMMLALLLKTQHGYQGRRLKKTGKRLRKWGMDRDAAHRKYNPKRLER